MTGDWEKEKKKKKDRIRIEPRVEERDDMLGRTGKTRRETHNYRRSVPHEEYSTPEWEVATAFWWQWADGKSNLLATWPCNTLKSPQVPTRSDM